MSGMFRGAVYFRVVDGHKLVSGSSTPSGRVGVALKARWTPPTRTPGHTAMWATRNARYQRLKKPYCQVSTRYGRSDKTSHAAEDMKITVSFGSETEEPRASSSDEAVSTSVASEGFLWKRGLPIDLAGGAVLTASVVMMAVIGFLLKPKEDSHGSVFDLVKRGQLRSDRGADSRPLNYEDPFNNPLVQVGDKNSTVKVDGKRFRVQPVMLTEEKVQSHQSRRTQAYRWKRPVVFLNEGDAVPDGVDPEEVRWIPSNHPFATTKNYIDEELAQKNVYQTKGVPSRVRAEHEALRRKMMEANRRESGTELPGDLVNEGWKDFGQEQIKP